MSPDAAHAQQANDSDNDNDFLEPWERWLFNPFVLAEGGTGFNADVWNVEMTFDEFSRKLKTAPVGPKDGSCYLQGAVNGNTRKDAAMRTLRVLVLDSDEGHDPKEIIARAREYGLHVLIHSTHSSTPEHPKYRVVVPLDSDVAVDKEQWKRAYRACATLLNVRFDKSCTNVSRLFYYPRHPADQQPWWLETSGAPISFAFLLACATLIEAAEENCSADAGEKARKKDEKPTLVTRNLYRFAVTCGALFDIEAFYSDQSPVDHVRGAAPGGGLHGRCPNQDGEVSGRPHTDRGPQRTPFRVVSPWNNKEGDGWTAHCLTGGCTEHFRGDRLLFLDAICQQLGITDAVELLAWCRDLDKARELYDDWKLTDEEREEERAAILAIMATPGWAATMPNAEGRRPFMRRVARAWPERSDRKMRARDIARAYGSGELRHDFLREIESAGAATGAKDKIDPTTYEGPISSMWDAKTRLDVTVAQLQRKNDTNPQLFRGVAGVVRTTGGATDIKLERVHTTAHWSNILTHTLTFDAGAHVEKDLLADVQGETGFDFPKCMQVLGCAVFAKDGSLKIERGYHAELEAYHDPQIEFLPVPDVVTPAHVAEAKTWIEEAIRDFPFSDCFGGGETLPIYLPSKDADGWSEPNKERGRSSRAHFYCYFLNGFLMHMIDDVAPLFHIDKHKPNTGASYLASVAMVTLMGKAPAQPMDHTKDGEFEKRITANLKDGAPIIFMDNISSKIASGGFAATLTGRDVKQRLLGGNNNLEVRNRFTWCTAGNNVEFSSENIRRILPIFLDAGEDDPKVREARGEMKHMMPSWVSENRAQLVWSAHVLVRFALQQGLQEKARAYSGPSITSFGRWSSVMGTLLEMIDVKGFLENIDAFQATKDEDRDEDKELLKTLWQMFTRGQITPQEFTSKDGYSATKSHLSFVTEGSDKEHALITLFGHRIKRIMGVNAFTDEHGAARKVRLVKCREKNPARYKIVVV